MRLLLVLMFLAPTFSIASGYTAGQLRSLCVSSDRADRNFCLGYISGYADRGAKNFYCIPQTISTTDLVDLLLIDLKRHPDRAGYPADVFLHGTLLHFSCTK